MLLQQQQQQQQADRLTLQSYKGNHFLDQQSCIQITGVNISTDLDWLLSGSRHTYGGLLERMKKYFIQQL